MITIPYITALTTYFSYGLLFAFGQFRDFFRKIFDWWRGNNLQVHLSLSLPLSPSPVYFNYCLLYIIFCIFEFCYVLNKLFDIMPVLISCMIYPMYWFHLIYLHVCIYQGRIVLYIFRYCDAFSMLFDIMLNIYWSDLLYQGRVMLYHFGYCVVFVTVL